MASQIEDGGLVADSSAAGVTPRPSADNSSKATTQSLTMSNNDSSTTVNVLYHTSQDEPKAEVAASRRPRATMPGAFDLTFIQDSESDEAHYTVPSLVVTIHEPTPSPELGRGINIDDLNPNFYATTDSTATCDEETDADAGSTTLSASSPSPTQSPVSSCHSLPDDTEEPISEVREEDTSDDAVSDTFVGDTVLGDPNPDEKDAEDDFKRSTTDRDSISNLADDETIPSRAVTPVPWLPTPHYPDTRISVGRLSFIDKPLPPIIDSSTATSAEDQDSQDSTQKPASPTRDHDVRQSRRHCPPIAARKSSHGSQRSSTHDTVTGPSHLRKRPGRYVSSPHIASFASSMFLDLSESPDIKLLLSSGNPTPKSDIPVTPPKNRTDNVRPTRCRPVIPPAPERTLWPSTNLKTQYVPFCVHTEPVRRRRITGPPLPSQRGPPLSSQGGPPLSSQRGPPLPSQRDRRGSTEEYARTIRPVDMGIQTLEVAEDELAVDIRPQARPVEAPVIEPLVTPPPKRGWRSMKLLRIPKFSHKKRVK